MHCIAESLSLCIFENSSSDLKSGSAPSSWGMLVGASGLTPCIYRWSGSLRAPVVLLLAPEFLLLAPVVRLLAPTVVRLLAPVVLLLEPVFLLSSLRRGGPAPCAGACGLAPCAGGPAPCAGGPAPCVRCPSVCDNCLAPRAFCLIP